MKGWLAANAFIFAMILVAAGLSSLGLYLVQHLGLDPMFERGTVVAWCVLAIIATGFAARDVLRRIEKRR